LGTTYAFGGCYKGPRGRHRSSALAILVSVSVGFALSAPSRAAEKVAFDVPYKGRTITIEGELQKPDGPGPFPVVIGLHACDGPMNYATNFWMTTLAAQGYATYLPNSFGPRGYVEVCGHTGWVTSDERAQDALLAAMALAARPDILPDKIAILGVSHGGGTALRISRDDPSLLGLREKLAAAGGKIVAVVSVYGACVPDIKRPLVVPLLILIGSDDDWSLPKPCEALASEGTNPALVQIHVYPGATHSFDNASLAIGVRWKGHWMVYDASATADARQRVVEFLGGLMR
jgi:dienelactone hydrolase